MSGVVDVGDALELTFSTVTGATVTATWLDPDQVAVIAEVEVEETPSGSGNFPYTFLASRAGVWTAQFRASGAATQFEQFWVRAASITGPPPLAVLGDVGAQFGTLTPAQAGIAGWLLRAASRLVRAQFPTIDANIDAGTLDAEVVALGVANMVLRVLRNPGGLRSRTVGPFSWTYDTTHAAGLLVVTAGEAAMFTAAVAPVTYPVGTIRVKAGLVPEKGRSRGWCW